MPLHLPIPAASESSVGPLLIAVANVVFAMNGEPEPAGDTDIGDVIARLHQIAARLREQQ